MFGLNDANRCFHSSAMKLVIRWKPPHHPRPSPQAREDVDVEQQYPLVVKRLWLLCKLRSLKVFKCVPCKKKSSHVFPLQFVPLETQTQVWVYRIPVLKHLNEKYKSDQILCY